MPISSWVNSKAYSVMLKACRLNFSKSLASVNGLGFITCLIGAAIVGLLVGGGSGGGGNMGNSVGGGDNNHKDDITS